LVSPNLAVAQSRITEAAIGLGTTGKDEIVNPTTQFAPDVPKIFCTWVARGVDGDTAVRGVWIAEDVGDVAPANYKIDEATLKIPGNATGTFSLSKPNNGFPIGKYRVEIYLGDDLAKTIPFTVKGK
jgi:hypothetical protein